MHTQAVTSLHRVVSRALRRSLGKTYKVLSLRIPEMKVPTALEPVCINCRFARDGKEFEGTVQLYKNVSCIILDGPLKRRVPPFDFNSYQPKQYDA